MDHCRNLFSACSMISKLKERLTAVEGEIEELEKKTGERGLILHISLSTLYKPVAEVLSVMWT